MLTGWGASKASAGYTGGQWQDATCYVRQSLKDTKDQSVIMEYFKKFQNVCVDKDQKDLKETAYSAGDRSLELCLQYCYGADTCTGVEWYNKKWNGKRCYFVSLGQGNSTPAAAGSAAAQKQDSVCFVKKNPEEQACSKYTKFQNFCVNKAGKDIPQTRWQAGQESITKCQDECNKNL